MEQSNNDEVNISDLLSSIKKGLIKGVVLFFMALDFILKKWIIITVLLVTGIVLGYFSQENSKPEKSAKLLIQINHDAVSYIYSEVEFINEKIKENDSLFFNQIGFKKGAININEIEITPIIDLTDIAKSYDVNDRNLEGLLRNLEFNNDEININETFISKYKYHILEIKLSDQANFETTNSLIKYFNSNEIIERLRDTTINDIKTHIQLNKNSISQIDKIIDNYSTTESLPSSSNQIYVVDKNFSIHGLLLKKSELQIEIEDLNKYLVYANEIVVIINKPSIIEVKPGLLGNKIIKYPVLFVFTFLLLAFFRYIYMYLRRITEGLKKE